MNTNKKELAIVKRAKKTLVGRCVCRLLGEETGAVMMEYVIVAVLIAAAVAVGAWMFGGTIMDMFGVASNAAAGDNSQAETTQANAQTAADEGHTQGAAAWRVKNTDGRGDNITGRGGVAE